MQRVGIVGVGLLGSAVASRLLAAGFPVTGYDTRPEQLAALAGQGLQAAADVAGAAAGAQAVITVLPSLDSAEAVVTGPGGLAGTAAPGTVLIQMSTISPELTVKLAEAARARGLDFLDCPISGTSAMVARGDCTLILGGEADVIARCRPICEAIAPKSVHMGPVGAAALAKLATNLLVALNTSALAEALVLGTKGGLEPARMLELLRGSAADSRMLEIRGPLMAANDYPPQMKLELFMKDLHLMLAAGERLGVPLPLTSVARQLYDETVQAGRAGEDLASVMTTLARKAGLPGA